MSVVPARIYACQFYLVLTEARKGCWTPWNWNYRWLCIATWVLAVQLRSSAEQHVLPRAISPALLLNQGHVVVGPTSSVEACQQISCSWEQRLGQPNLVGQAFGVICSTAQMDAILVEPRDERNPFTNKKSARSVWAGLSSGLWKGGALQRTLLPLRGTWFYTAAQVCSAHATRSLGE